MARKSPLVRISTNNAVITVYDYNLAQSVISAVLKGEVPISTINTQSAKNTVSTVKTTTSTNQSRSRSKPNETKKVEMRPQGTKRSQQPKKHEQKEDQRNEDKYEWVYEYIRQHGYIPLEKIKSKRLGEWISKRGDIVHLTSLGCFTSDEVFNKLSWDDSEAYYKCGICGKRFAYGDLLKALRHVAEEHLTEKK